MKSGNLNFLEPSWPLQACNGTALPLPLLDRVGWSTPRPGRSTPGKRPDTHCIGGWVGPRAGLMDAENLAPPGFDPRTVQPVTSRYTGPFRDKVKLH